MFDEARFDRRVQEALRALKKSFGGSPRDLRQALSRAGRRLPLRARKAGAEILSAQGLAGHPKLQQQLDSRKLDLAFDRLIAGAKSVDVGELRKQWLLGALAAAVFNVLLFLGLFLAFAHWRGLI
ncbi:hypothetical protein [Pseudooceanicola sp.]|uniref:hypothetical protein n=1 Tax=Pseudooceanicola sp. TaxID=1914328 RepID=UPI0035C711ED